MQLVQRTCPTEVIGLNYLHDWHERVFGLSFARGWDGRPTAMPQMVSLFNGRLLIGIHCYQTQVPVSLRNMIGRSFETQDAHDQIRAAIIDLFEVLHIKAEANIPQVRTL